MDNKHPQVSPMIFLNQSDIRWPFGHVFLCWMATRLKNNFSMNYERPHQVDLCRESVLHGHTVSEGKIQYTYLSSLNDRSSFRDEFQSMRILVYVIYLLDLWIFWAKVVGDVDCLVGYLSQHANHQLTLWSGWTMASCSCLNWHTLSKTRRSKPKPLHIWVHPIWEEFLHFESFQRFTHVAVPTCSDQVWDGLVPMIVLDEWS